jgi:hypothetical protein
MTTYEITCQSCTNLSFQSLESWIWKEGGRTNPFYVTDLSLDRKKYGRHYETLALGLDLRTFCCEIESHIAEET